MHRKLGYLLLAALLVASLGLLVGCPDDAEETTTTAAPTETTAGPTETTAGAEDGATVFADNCSPCHGADGGGSDRAPNLQERDQLVKDRVVDQVTNGGTQMPAFGDRLSPEQIDAVADHVINEIVPQ